MGYIGGLYQWQRPTTEASWTKVRIYRSDTQTGVFTQIAEQAISDTTYWDLYATPTSWWRIAFYDEVAAVLSDQSPAMQNGRYRGYATINEVRTCLLVQTSEFDNTAIQMMIDNVTQAIDLMTGRTWQGIKTSSIEYFDGTGERVLYLDKADIQSISSIEYLEGDRSVVANWKTLTPSKVLLYGEEGKLIIDTDQSPETTIFPFGNKKVRMTYTYGNDLPTDDVKHLCILMVANMIKLDATRIEEINRLLSILSKKGIKAI